MGKDRRGSDAGSLRYSGEFGVEKLVAFVTVRAVYGRIAVGEIILEASDQRVGILHDNWMVSNPF